VNLVRFICERDGLYGEFEEMSAALRRIPLKQRRGEVAFERMTFKFEDFVRMIRPQARMQYEAQRQEQQQQEQQHQEEEEEERTNTTIDSSSSSASPRNTVVANYDQARNMVQSVASGLKRCGNPECGSVESSKGQHKACSACRTVYYCGRRCQTSHWKHHKAAGCRCRTK